MKAGLKPFEGPLIVEGFCPAVEGGGRAGRDGWEDLEDVSKPGGGGYDMLSLRSCNAEEE